MIYIKQVESQKFLLIVFLLLTGGTVFSQSPAQHTTIPQIKEVAELRDSLSALRVQRFMKEKNVTSRYFKTLEGSTFFLSDIDSTGHPTYIKTYNDEAAITVGVDELRNNQELGVHLTGKNIKIGIWEVAGLLPNHVEFGGRVNQRNTFTRVDNHATHVTGTIIAGGVNNNARGMAYEANALFYTANGDLNEMTSQATPDQSSILISNHSYGTSAGWERVDGEWKWFGNALISEDEDYRFGFYDTDARDMDALAYSAPYYTIVKAAGNDRNDSGDGSRPSDGPYDAISTWGNAKNIITVGATSKIPGGYNSYLDVNIASFSSYGPTDDGRIKPDITAPGIDLFSPISTDSTYGTLSGTSMASPTVAGSLALLQELAKQETNNFLKAATLKALMIHSANKAVQEEGPNYRYGWGLLNAKGAAEIILKKDGLSYVMDELSLNNGQVYEVEINPNQGVPVIATLVWTDPEGDVSKIELDPTDLRLVNDLDMRLVDERGVERRPWVLDPASERGGAVRGDNFRDNVEKIEFNSPEPRKYTLRITHKNELRYGKQDFSLILTYDSRFSDNRRVLYYIGTDGTWNNPQNWSLSSGGGSANTLPGAADRVVIDENSFPADGAELKLQGNTTVHALTWLNKGANSFNFDSHILTTGSFLVNSANLQIPSGGTIILNGTEGLDLNELDFKLVDVVFDNLQASWKLTDQLIQVKSLSLNKGTLILDGSEVNSETLETFGTANKSLSLISTSFMALQQVNFSGTNMNIDATDAIFNFDGSTPSYFSANGLRVDGRLNVTGNAFELQGANSSIRTLNLQSTGTIASNYVIDSLLLSQGANLKLNAAVNVTISDWFDVVSSATENVIIQGDEISSGTITINNHAKYCFDNLQISNIDAAGSTKISVGTNSTLINSAGWLEIDCADVLFADFEVQYSCVDGLTFLTNTSTGNITEYSWDFGDGATSTLRDAYHIYEDIGLFTVTLTITDGVSTEEYSMELNILENTPLPNKVVQDRNRLVSEKPATGFQWFLNGVPLEGATERIYELENKGGTYFVVTLNQACNNVSDSLTIEITSIEDFPSSPESSEETLVYPNPASNSVFIHTPRTSGNFQVQIIDLKGKTLYLRDDLHPGIINEISINELSPGVYWLKIVNDKESIERKILKLN